MQKEWVQPEVLVQEQKMQAQGHSFSFPFPRVVSRVPRFGIEVGPQSASHLHQKIGSEPFAEDFENWFRVFQAVGQLPQISPELFPWSSQGFLQRV
ncbi:MAG: hypothetical protein ACXAE3_11195 [Candidatus Kariarchaeaceae archaeon]